MIKINKKQKQFIEEKVLALASVDANGAPNVVAVACCKLVEGNKILITDNFMNKTRKNLLNNKETSIAVWSEDWEEGYQFKGEAQYFSKGKWKKMVDEMSENNGLPHKGAVLFTIKEIWDLANPKKLC
ncbi:hypothetical protein GF362_03775 [Candidatus Dojkabacteria bacterium]|nr:hypothetical protein [Candidatus Dojkabacteria bacterium]